MTAFDFRSARVFGLIPWRRQLSPAPTGEIAQRRRAEVNAAGVVGATAALPPADRPTLLDVARARWGF